jgi:uncharacterized protein involved in outer membrane biogenesis
VSRGRKLIIGCALAILLVAVVLVIVVPQLVDLDHYRPQVVAHIQAETAKPASVGHLSLSIFPRLSIRVDDFALGNPRGFPPGHFVEVRRIHVLVDAGALWHRQVIINSLEFDDPSINLLSDGHGHWNFENPPKKPSSSPGSKPFFSLGVISRVSLRGGQVTVSNLLSPSQAGPAYSEARGVSSQLREVDLNAFSSSASAALRAPLAPGSGALGSIFGPSLLYAATPASQPTPAGQPAAQGNLSAEWVRFQEFQATSVKSQLRLYPKRVYFDDLRFDTCGGGATGDFSLNFGGLNLLYSARARLTGVDIAKLFAALPSLRGKMTGVMEGSAEISGEVPRNPEPLAGMHGAGQVTIRNGQLPTLQLNKNLLLLARLSNLGPASGDPSSFSSLAADFTIADQKITSRKITLVGNGVNVDGSGTLGVAGAGSLEYQGVGSIAAGQNLVTSLLAGLSGARLEGGKLALPFAVTGTLEKPSFTLKPIPGQASPLGAAQTQGNQPGQPANLLQGISNLFKKKK